MLRLTLAVGANLLGLGACLGLWLRGGWYLRRNLTDDQRSALGMLAASLRGRTESTMLAHSFAIGMLRGLVRVGLAAAVREPAYYNRRDSGHDDADYRCGASGPRG
jgi:hypothetical protein